MTVGDQASAARAPARLVFDRAPQRVYWEVTRACDLACRHCRAEAIAGRDPAELSTAEGLRLLERLATFGEAAPHLVLTGGDPLKRPDLFMLIAAARTAGLAVAIAPSATPLLEPAVVGRFQTAGVEAISLSLDGATPAQHDALRGIPGTFERTLAAARAARAAGLPFQINTLVAAQTLDQLPAISLLAAALGAARWSLFFLVSVGRGTVLQPLTPPQSEELLRWLAALAAQGGEPIVTTTEAPQFRRVLLELRVSGRGHGAGIRDGNGIMFISHTGAVYPSGFLPLAAGNVRTDDVLAIYRESPLFRTLRHADAFNGRCGRCEFRWHCGGSRARAYAASGDLLGEDPLCGYQPATGAVS